MFSPPFNNYIETVSINIMHVGVIYTTKYIINLILVSAIMRNKIPHKTFMERFPIYRFYKFQYYKGCSVRFLQLVFRRIAYFGHLCILCTYNLLI